MSSTLIVPQFWPSSLESVESEVHGCYTNNAEFTVATLSHFYCHYHHKTEGVPLAPLKV